MFLLPVHARRQLSPDVFELELERRGYPFVPGECAVLWDDGAESRPYSIASGPAEAVLRFLVRRMPGGTVSTWLSRRRVGEGVRISTPFGDFRPGQSGAPGHPAAFVATGVGVAPFLSYLHATASAPPPVAPVCLYGVRHARDAAHLDLLRARTDLHLAVSRERVTGWHAGRVTDLLEALPRAPDAHYYLCGLDAMVDAVAYWLDARGIDHARVHTEVFFSSEESRA